MYRHAGSICRRTVLVLLSAVLVLGVSSGSRTSPNFRLSPSVGRKKTQTLSFSKGGNGLLQQGR